MESIFPSPGTSQKTVPGTAFPIVPRRILVVEDHESTATVLQRLLRRHGHQVWIALDYRSALEAVRTHPVEVVICDLGLPDGDGCDLMMELRSEKPICGIVLSGRGEPEDLARSREAGFSAHLLKPLDVTQIERTLSEIFSVSPDQPLSSNPVNR